MSALLCILLTTQPVLVQCGSGGYCMPSWLPQSSYQLTAEWALLCFKAVGFLWLKGNSLIVVGRVFVRLNSEDKIYSQAFKCEAIQEDTYCSYISVKKTRFFLQLF